ncbi:hypothetical protein LMJ41_05265 [Streptomyces globisporus]|nr:hypothetical protein [Streptomyces globisporus]
MLRADLDAPRKQRHTITRTFHQLVQEHSADVSYQMVRRYVSDRKPEILAASGKAPEEAFAPQSHLPGHEAEADFGDVTVRLADELVTCYLGLGTGGLAYSTVASSAWAQPAGDRTRPSA